LTLQTFNPSNEFISNLYELYSDIADYYGQGMRGQFRNLQGAKILRDALNSFNFEGIE